MARRSYAFSSRGNALCIQKYCQYCFEAVGDGAYCDAVCRAKSRIKDTLYRKYHAGNTNIEYGKEQVERVYNARQLPKVSRRQN